eukprot:GGOE01036568.1.p1 GENE.GGOE01036568.1~~GGOE01036568.1.p1  ORF type:complete len:370 (-),score=117.95 GGOE01036568.1:220-1329(-)
MATRGKHHIDPPQPIGAGCKRYLVHGTTFDVPTHYDITRAIGYGAFGFVVAAVDQRTEEKVAIKKCLNVFCDLEDGKRVLREIKLLTFLVHENILHIRDLLPPATLDFEDVYFVTALMDTDLNNVIRSKQRLTDDHIAYFAYQLLRALKFLHSAHILHRDLKPANLLTNVNCDLMVADFGLARGYTPGQTTLDMTDYVVTRWYRAPELLLMLSDYTGAIDVWSTGCIFAELYNRTPLFQGNDYLGQLNLICEAIGVPSDLPNFVGIRESLNYLKTFPGAAAKPVEELVPTLTTASGKDFLLRMLTFNPRKRATAMELLLHPHLSRLHDPSDEPQSSMPFDWDAGFDHFDTEADLRAVFLEEIRKFYPDS